MLCVEAKDEDKKDAAMSSSVSSSVLNLAGIGSLGKEKRQHNGVSVLNIERSDESTIRKDPLTPCTNSHIIVSLCLSTGHEFVR